MDKPGLSKPGDSAHADLVAELSELVPADKLNPILTFDPHRLPPKLEDALLHSKSARISKPVQAQEGQNYQICPCCCAIATEPYPLCTPSSEIVNYGPAIPMYFQFSKYVLLLAGMFVIFCCYGQYEIIYSNCLLKRNYKYDRCGPNLVTLIDVGLRDGTKKYHNVSKYLNLVMNMLCVVVLYLLHRAQLKLGDRIDKDFVSPAAFTVVITHLKEEETNDTYIREYIANVMEHNKREPVEILKINYGRYEGNLVRIEMDIAETEYALEHFRSKTKAATSVNPSQKTEDASGTPAGQAYLEQKCTQLEAKLSGLRIKLQGYKDSLAGDGSFKDNSVAFVTLQTQAQALSVLSTQTARTQLAATMSRLCNLKRRVHVMERPAEPADYKWKFMGFSIFKQTKTVLVAWGACLLLISVSFCIQLALKMVQKSYVNSLGDSGTWATSFSVKAIQIGATVFVGLFNKALALVTLKLSRYEKHLTTSDFLVSHTKKLVVFQFANSAGIAVGLLLLPEDLGGLESLNLFVFFLLATNIFMGPLNQVLDPVYMLRVMKGSGIERKLKNGEFVPLTQSEYHEVRDPPEIGFFFRYSNTVRMFLVSVFFSSTLPIGTLVCFIYLANQYWFDKWMILRRYKEIPRLNSELGLRMSSFLEVTIFLFSLGNVIFRSKAVKSYDKLEILSLVLSVFLLIFPLMEVSRRFHNKEVLESKDGDSIELMEHDFGMAPRTR